MGLGKKAVQVQHLAAEKLIEEGGPYTELVQDSAEAQSRADEIAATVNGTVTYQDDGVVTVGYGTGGNLYAIDLYPRDSTAFQSVVDSFSWVVDSFKYARELPNEKHAARTALADLAVSFDPGGQLASLAATMDANAHSKGSTLEEVAAESPSGPAKFEDWASLTTVSRTLAEWRGHAVQDFLVLYGDRFQYILTGQAAAISISHQTLAIANEAYSNARENAASVADETINALNALGDDADWEAILTVLSAVATIVGGATALAAAPATFGAAGISGIAGIVAGTASLGVVAAGDDPSEDPHSLGGATVYEVLENMQGALEKIQDDVGDVERRTAEWLTDFQLSIDQKSGAEVDLSTGTRTLTVREAYFEPPKPALASVGSALIDKTGSSLSASEAEDASSTLFDTDNLGRTTSLMSDLVDFDIEALKSLGEYTLAGAADQYLSVASAADGITDDAASEFSDGAKEDNVPDGVYAHSGIASPLYDAWKSVHAMVVEFLSNSGENLQMVADTLQLAADAFAELDNDTAKEIWKGMDIV